MFSRDFRRQQRAKCKHIFEIWCVCVVVCSFGGGFYRVHWSRGRPAFEESGPAIGWLWSSLGVFRPFALPLSLSCFACGALHLNMALFRILRGFLEGFMVLMYICMGLGFALIVGLLCA